MLSKNAIKGKPGCIASDICKRLLSTGNAINANTIAITTEPSVIRKVSLKN